MRTDRCRRPLARGRRGSELGRECDLRSLDDVLEWCRCFAKIIGEDLEIDVRPAAKHGTLLERGSSRCAFAIHGLTCHWTDASACR